MAKNTGGTAFPVARDPAFPKTSESAEPKPGMTLRDYFAAKAMQSLIADKSDGNNCYEIANIAYFQADAMIAERAK